MPVREIVNALYLTYMGTEYLLASSSSSSSSHKPFQQQQTGLFVGTMKRHKLVTGLVIGINALEQMKIIITSQTLWQVRIVLAALAYVIALYVDCKKSQPKLTLLAFLKQVSVAFCRILPVYPILAVFISFIFLFVISIFEALHLPVELLNWPIYSGILYGPLSYIYYTVKRHVVEATQSLPTTITTTTTTTIDAPSNSTRSVNNRRIEYYSR